LSVKGESPEFEPLPLRRRALAALDANQYCIWTRSGETKEIKADTAYEAVKMSGLKGIFKIERAFNSRQNILDKSRFAHDAAPEDHLSQAGAAMENETAHDRIRRRRNPLISVDELDELMRALKQEAIASQSKAASQDAAASDSAPLPQQMGASSGPGSVVMEHPAVPEPEGAPQAEVTTSPIGLDVHGDGFDEIIPSAPSPAKAATHKAEAPKEAPKSTHSGETMAQPSADALPPERELSPEEVEKLLGSK
jgi:hypothetical protein